MENFLKQNWRSLSFIGFIFFSLFVWPTRHVYWNDEEGLMRRDRLTGKIEVYYWIYPRWCLASFKNWQEQKKERIRQGEIEKSAK